MPTLIWVPKLNISVSRLLTSRYRMETHSYWSQTLTLSGPKTQQQELKNYSSHILWKEWENRMFSHHTVPPSSVCISSQLIQHRANERAPESQRQTQLHKNQWVCAYAQEMSISSIIYKFICNWHALMLCPKGLHHVKLISRVKSLKLASDVAVKIKTLNKVIMYNSNIKQFNLLSRRESVYTHGLTLIQNVWNWKPSSRLKYFWEILIWLPWMFW